MNVPLMHDRHDLHIKCYQNCVCNNNEKYLIMKEMVIAMCCRTSLLQSVGDVKCYIVHGGECTVPFVFGTSHIYAKC